MNELFDILLAQPLSQNLNNVLLFVTFVLHLLFVLFAVGTAVIGVTYFVAGRWGGREEAGPGPTRSWVRSWRTRRCWSSWVWRRCC